MADRHLPAVPSSPGPGAEATELISGRRAAPAEGGPASWTGDPGAEAGTGPPRAGSSTRRRAGLAVDAALLAGGLIVVLGLASLVGDAVRSAVLVEVDRSPVGSQPSYSDAPAEAAAFFARRDTVRVRVPRDMTVADFLALYHLETNAAARAALRDQLGAAAEGDVLREGDEVVLTLTVPRAER